MQFGTGKEGYKKKVMAILFGRVSNITRESGGSAVKAAAYRSCSKLSLSATDKATNITAELTWDYSKKKGLAYSQIHAPENAPDWVYDRQSLWQRIEDIEVRKDSRLAGEYTLALPKEFTVEQNIDFLKDFVEEVFVSRGIVVDVNYHNDNPKNPHVHLMYVLRELVEKLGGEIDFSSYRCRQLQARAFLEGIIKEVHCRLLNIHLKKNGFEQELKWGVAKDQEAMIHHGGIKEVIAKNEQIIFQNAQRIIADPTIVIEKLDFNKPVFSKEDIEKELEKALLISFKNIAITDKSALDIYIKNELVGLLDTVLFSPKLTLINPCDLKGRMLFAKTEQVELEKRFVRNIENLAVKSDHVLIVKEEDIAPYAKDKEFSKQQKQVIMNICAGGDLSVLEGYPGAGKSTVTKEIARHYRKAGYQIIAAAPTNKAAQELESKLGIKVYTTSSLRMKWQHDRGAKEVSIGLSNDYYKQPLYDLKEGAMNSKTLLILDEASMLDVATSDYFASEVVKSGAKLLSLGDNNQNQAIGAKGAFARKGEIGNYNILTEVNRHQNPDEVIKDEHMKATHALCNYNVSKALSIYDQLGKINISENEEAKEAAIVASYIAKVLDIANEQSIDVSEAAKDVVIGAYTNAEISRLNSLIRDSLKSSGSLTKGALFRSGGIHGKSSMVELSVGDRIIFTSNLREKEGVGGVFNNELAIVRKLISVDDMGRGEFLVEVEGASGVRQALIRTGEEGRIVTFKHGYAVTNYAVQGASVPYKLYSVDQYNGYSSFLVGLTRHKIDCLIFAARSTLENEVFKTKDFDIEKVREEYKAIGYKYIQKKDDDGEITYEKVDVPLWKIGMHLLASKHNDMSFAIDSSYGSASIELQKSYNAYSDQLELMRKDLNIHEEALGKYEVLANTPISVKDSKNGISKLKFNRNQKEVTGFELNVSQHFNLKENIIVDIAEILASAAKFKIENFVKIEDHIVSLKNGVISEGKSSLLNWSDLSKDDQNIILWSYIDKEDREELTNHYKKALNLSGEIQDKADSLSSIWQELKDSGYKKQECLDGNYKVVKEYLAARVRVIESYKQEEILNNRLSSGRVQKLLIEGIEEKYGIKLKFIDTNINDIGKAENKFNTQKQKKDSELFENNNSYKAKSLEEDRFEYLKSLKKEEFKSIIANSSLFVADIMKSAKEGSELEKLGTDIELSRTELAKAKEECMVQANSILKNWNGHVSEEFAKDQPSFRKIIGSLNINYHTLVKHAGLHEEKHYFEKLLESSLGKNADYHAIMHSIYKAQEKDLTTSEVNDLVKAHDGLCEYVEIVSDYIEELKQERLSLQNDLSRDNIKVKEIKAYQSHEFPHFLGTIYQEDSKSVISSLNNLLEKTEDKKQLSALISANPEMLGSVKARGLIARVFNGKEKQIVDANLSNLGDRLARYIDGTKDMQEIQQVREKAFIAKLYKIDNEIKSLRTSLPSPHEISILEEIGKLQDFVLHGGNQDQNIATFTKKINNLLAGDKAQDALFNYQIKQKLFFAKEKEGESEKENKLADIVNISKYKSERAEVASLNKSLQRRSALKNQEKKFKYSWSEVKQHLTPSAVENIFDKYIRDINSDDKIEKKRNELIGGTLRMNLSDKLGLWHRFSTGEKGDIFQFVQEATGCSKKESLEIVASYAGLRENNEVSKSKRRVSQSPELATQSVVNAKQLLSSTSWVAKPIVPYFAKEFKPEKDLAFILNKNNSTITNTHEYRNANNQLLGYTVRIADQDGKKQVMPVAYCYDENGISKQEGWMLKGFLDNGAKPIYGLEKLAMNPEKAVLIVEGEKTAEAATKLFPEYNVISWMGGAQGVGRVDWGHLKDRVVTIWGDNDRAGAEAAKNIVNYIDQKNGFAGLVSIVDTDKLKLPEKWDLADAIPQDSKIYNIELNKVIQEAREHSLTVGAKLEKNHNALLESGNSESLRYFTNYLVFKEGMELDQHSSKEIYNDTMTAIAKNKDIDISKMQSPRDMQNAVYDIQQEYKQLHREYDLRYALSGDINKQDLTKEAKLSYEIKRDISVLHQLHLDSKQLPKTHMDHIEKVVNTEIGKLSRFADSDKQGAADAAYKIINSPAWRKELDQKNAEKSSDIALRFTAKSIDEFLRSKQEARATLEHIRKYEIDEKPILSAFKTDRDAGMEKMQEISSKLSIASGFVEENKALINEAREFGYDADHNSLVKSLVGMEKNKANEYVSNICNKFVKDYFADNLYKIRDKLFSVEYSGQKEMLKAEQAFLKEAYSKVDTSINIYDRFPEVISYINAAESIKKSPEKLDEFFSKCEVLRSELNYSPRDIYEVMIYSRNIDNLIEHAETNIERYNVYKIPQQLGDIRENAESIKEVFTAIENEQNKLAALHGNIKYIAYDHDALDKCQKAYLQKEDKSLEALKEISHKSLETGAKTEKELVAELQQVTDLKVAYIQLDKDIEAHHISSTLTGFEHDKQNAKTADVMLNIMSKEQGFLSSLHSNIKYPEENKDILEKCELAKEQKEDKSLEALKEISHKSLETGVRTEKELISDLQQVTDLKVAYIQLDKDIESHHINSNLMGFEHDKQNAKTADVILNIMSKEQDFLSSLHSNIKYPEENKDILEKCELAHNHKESKELDTLKLVVNQSLKAGAKTEKELVTELQKVTDLKATHTKLDKETEAHHINTTLQSFAKEKESVEDVERMAGVLYKEAKFLSEYSKNMRHDDHTPEIMKQIEYGKIAHENNHVKMLLDTTNYGYQRDIFDRKEILHHYKSQGSIHDINEHLSKICRDHNANTIGNHIEKIKEDGLVKHDGHEFECPIKYLEHWKRNVDHNLLPLANIERRIEKEHNHQMQLKHSMTL